MYNPYFHFPEDTVISISKVGLEKLLKEAESSARFNLLRDVKERLGFSHYISFDDVPDIVKGWKEKAERGNQ